MYKKGKIIMALLLVAALGFGSFFVLPALARAIGDGLPALSQALAAGTFDFGDGADENEGALDEVALGDGVLDEDVEDEASAAADVATAAAEAAEVVEDLAPFAPLQPAADGFATYTIVDPGNGENGVDVLTWEQVIALSVRRSDPNVYDWRMFNGDTVNIRATGGPSSNNIIYMRFDMDNDTTVATSTISGVPGITYDNISIVLRGDTVFQDLSIRTTEMYALSDQNIPGTSVQNYDMTISVIGDCSFESISTVSASGMRNNSMAAKNLTFDGTGTLKLLGYDYGLYADGREGETKEITINIPLTLEAYGSDAMAGFTITNRSDLRINGNGCLTAIAAGHMGSGIFLNNASASFNGGLDIYAKGSGVGHGLELRARTMIFDLANDAVFVGGASGSGLYISNVGFTGVGYEKTIVHNKGDGNIICRGGEINGDGLRVDYHLILLNDKSGRFIANGGGTGNGMRMNGSYTQDRTLDISGLNYDFVLMGGESVPIPSMYDNFSSGLYTRSLVKIILGSNNLLCHGGANGGAGITTYDSGLTRSEINIDTNGGEIYALGGRGDYGYGIWPVYNTLTLSGNATITAYGNYRKPGINIDNNAYIWGLSLSDSIFIKAIGGEEAIGLSLLGSGVITFVDNTTTLTITNHSNINNVNPFTATSGGVWDLTDATLTAGALGDANVTVSIAPGVTGMIRR